MEASLILEARDLTVVPTNGAAPVIEGVGFRLHSSEILGIFGESGAGKTVLSRALADWLPESLTYAGGSVAFAGKDIRGGPSACRIGRDIAYIGSKPQSSLDPTEPVGVQIAEKLRSVRPEWTARDCRDRVLQLLTEVRIPSPQERYWDYPSKFSGGMMQRAMIVDAICAEPAVLIADNITQPLDVTIAAQIVALLHDLCLKHRMATIYLSASLATLGQFGGRTAVLQHGRLVEQQGFADLIARPQSDYTAKAIANVPRIWSTADGPVSRRRAGEAPLMRILDAHRTYKVRKRGTFNTYRNVQAVRGVTFDILPRENFGIVGESGCGKSTLTRLLAWLETPDRGDIQLAGTSLAALSRRSLLDKRSEFQLLLQDPYNALPPRTTVGRMIEEGLRLRGGLSRRELRERVVAAMREVGLAPALYDQLPNALSTGERQRISIARALILSPKLLILDETLSALDQGEQAKLIDLFSQLQEKNDLTYVFISHDLAMVRKVCTRIAVMYLGEMVEIADNHDLFFDPQHPYTKALLSAAPTLEDKPFDPGDYLLEGEPPSPIDIPPGCSFASRCPQAFGRCRAETPRLREHKPGRFAACHLLDTEEVGEAAAA
ncbi:ABC transporter ATP-binding protein [Labrys wisconsinensis]|uniref:Peptide/nickel transport system ATP-binding protein n=1 Tax=Labrys wisconsinensis TaxID=425677 RepID=A0ABU0J0A4_9HYPH|nr:ABC transporter ATP-binding protein [Labrys wisconsinensis]MDQ0467696.1 peptide/nickel transport system ATP-binding protein [Labrys wisconsinensis]